MSFYFYLFILFTTICDQLPQFYEVVLFPTHLPSWIMKPNRELFSNSITWFSITLNGSIKEALVSPRRRVLVLIRLWPAHTGWVQG